MGLLVDGVWRDEWYDTRSTGGKFVRTDTAFRNWVTVDGSAGESGEGGFKAESGRYHLYVSVACPWAHRCMIFRVLKGLEPHISMSVVHAVAGEHGWTFHEGNQVVPDPIHKAEFLYQVYLAANSGFTGRVTVPVLWDREASTIVNNESSEIIRMFNSAFDEVGASGVDYYPEALRAEIDSINAFVYHAVNNGVYRAGFATTQQAYDEAVVELFEALDTLEERLSRQRFLVGDQITEADWRLFTTLLRFDPVYVGHFKCNIRRIQDYPNLWGFVRDLYQMPGVTDTIDMAYTKEHYYASHGSVNPTGVVPAGPDIDFEEPVDRGSM